MRGRVLQLLLCLLMLAGLAPAGLAAAEKRAALVIGNGAYSSVPELPNPANDSEAVAGRLRELGFAVTLLRDLDKESFEAKVREFSRSLDGAEAAVFYYAGHGLRVDGRNYMVPIDADVSNEADLPFQLVAVDIVLQRLAHHRITNIVILDACRDNPLPESLRRRLANAARLSARASRASLPAPAL